MRSAIARLARMDRAEVGWRATSAGRALLDRVRSRIVEPRWSRTDLRNALATAPDLEDCRKALKAQRWDDAHRELARHFALAPRRFPLSAQSRPTLLTRLARDFPDARRDAADRADRIVGGEYDLLGYERLNFGAGLPDWHLDPVHGRTAPRTFWSTVPYLDASCGDHKIIWELNRHQHWLVLGRAFWITGDDRYRDRFLAELRSWLDDNPPLTGINWASMLELAFRSISWLWAIPFFVTDDAGEQPWLVDLLVALDRQLTHVEHNLSHYFSPNTHLLGEALALYVAGLALPELAASSRRVVTGRRILLQEIDRQIAADGGHCERSTHYHRYTLDFYTFALASARLARDEAAGAFEDAVIRLASAARLLADDNGRVPHIGDDDAGALMPLIAREPDDLRGSLAIAAALTGRGAFQIDGASEEPLWLIGPSVESARRTRQSAIPSAALPETGYYVSRAAAGHHLLIDGGPHGYQNGGHAHADALSMTLTVRGAPLLIDPGTACYTIDAAQRDRMRSTALHNTLTLDRRSQSLPRGPFHWSHVANGQVHRWHAAPRFDYFDGSHDGYGSTRHRRRVLAIHGDLIVVADLVDGSGAHAADVHWHVDPRWIVETHARGATFTRPGDRVGLTVPHGTIDGFSGDEQTGLGWCSPAYGRVERATTVRVRHAAAAPYWMVSVFDLDRENPVDAVEWVPVWAEAGAVAHATAIRITRASSIDHVLFAERRQEDGDPVPSVRMGDVDTTARVLCCRSTVNQPAECLAIVDGSFTRGGDQRRTPPDQGLMSCAALRVS
jgi:hypothetical protein